MSLPLPLHTNTSLPHSALLLLVCSFAAVFSPAKRRQLELSFSDSPRRSILSRRSPGVGGVDEEDGFPQAGPAGYRKTSIIPVLRRTGKRQGTVRRER
jgi:hypothetical protein